MRRGFEAPAKQISKISYCAEQVRQHNPDRFLCALFAPADKREGLMALAAFELELAAIQGKVREAMMGRIRLAWWREAVTDLYAGTVRGHEVLKALAAERVPDYVTEAQLISLVDAREAEFEEEPFPTSDALIEYAGAIGGGSLQSAVQFLGGPATALEAGTGLGLVEFLRSIPAQAADGYLCLPLDLMQQVDIDPHAITPANIDKIRITVSLIAEEARRFLYFRGHPGLDPGSKAKSSKLGNQVKNSYNSSSGPRSPIKSGMTELKMDRAILPAFLPIVIAKLHLKRLAKVEYNPFAPELAAPMPLKPLQLASAWATGKI